jgi:hypothetical protein
MKSIYEELPTVEIAGRKFVGRVLFSLLVLISALVGATAGLLLVYTTDFPRSTPSKTTGPVRSPNFMTTTAA